MRLGFLRKLCFRVAIQNQADASIGREGGFHAFRWIHVFLSPLPPLQIPSVKVPETCVSQVYAWNATCVYMRMPFYSPESGRRDIPTY